MQLIQPSRPPIVTLAISLLPTLQPGEALTLEGLPMNQPDRRTAYLKVCGMAYNLFGAGRCRVQAPLGQDVVTVTRIDPVTVSSGGPP